MTPQDPGKTPHIARAVMACPTRVSLGVGDRCADELASAQTQAAH